MTLAIQRQPRFNKVLLALGLMAVVAGLAVAMNRAVESTDVGNPAVVQTHTNPGLGDRFEAIQDDYLGPRSILSRQTAMQAELRLQDGFLPPASTVGSAREAWLMIQDGYLPPTDNAPSVGTSEQSTTSVRFGPR